MKLYRISNDPSNAGCKLALVLNAGYANSGTDLFYVRKGGKFWRTDCREDVVCAQYMNAT